jgi:hypothetical protein
MMIFRCFSEDDDIIYSGYRTDLDSNYNNDLSFYANGHPYVHRIEVQRFRILPDGEPQDVHVDRKPELLKTWHERNERGPKT